MPRKKKTKLVLNDISSLTHLMQETYNDACSQQHEAQKAMNEMATAAEPEDVDDYTKIAREKANLLKVKESAIKVKLELSKIKSDLIKNAGTSTESTSAESSGGASMEDFKTIRQMLKDGANSEKNTDKDTETYEV